MASIDLSLVSARRPELLSVTIDSFKENLFSNFDIKNIYVNVDPIFGTDADHRSVVSIIHQSFPEAIIFEPLTPGFGAAVKRLWSATTADYVFHLEDDWIALRNLDNEILRPFAAPHVQQVSFHTADQNWDIGTKGHIHEKKHYFRAFGIKTPFYRIVPKFTTSPSILRGSFARAAAELMMAEHDPEKQFYCSVNPTLEKMAQPFQNYIFSPEGVPVIKDIGREWREVQGIRKVITNGTSIWSPADNTP